jgi:hypothetical protein
VRIVIDVFLTSDSAVSASSALGVPGTVDIGAGITDVSGSVARLPESPPLAAALLRESCAARYSDAKPSALLVGARDGLPPEPGGTVPSPLLLGETAGAEASRAVGNSDSQLKSGSAPVVLGCPK